jgi:mono/diheme cytochrome c family protein
MWWLAVAGALAGGDGADDSVQAGMVGHFEAASYTFLSVAIDDMKGVREHAKTLWEGDGVPQAVRMAAGEIRKCRKLDCGGPEVAKLARTCASCHVQGGVGPQPSGMEALPQLPPTEQHAVAAMYMWIGLVTPHQRAYEIGLEGAVPPIDLDSRQELFDALQTFESMVARAQAAESWDARADAFGEMLQTCAGCHELAGVDKRIKGEQKKKK